MCHSKVVAWFRPEQLEGWSFHSPKRQRLQEGTGFGKMIKNLVTDVLSLRCPLDRHLSGTEQYPLQVHVLKP